MKQVSACGRRVRGFFRDRRSRACFLGTALFGALSYLYLFTNLVNNNDMIACTPWGYGTGLSSGRWMLYALAAVVERVWGLWNVPMFNGLLALLLLGLTSAVLVRLFGIQSKKLCFCLAAITASAAPIASMMLFTFTVHYYMLALLLLVCGAYLLTKRGGLRFASAVVLFACAIGIYQAYLPFLAAVLLLRLIYLSLQPGTQGKPLLLTALKFLAALVLAYVLYLGVLQVFLLATHTQLSSYQNIDRMGVLRLSALPSLMKNAYVHFFLLPLQNYHYFNATGVVRLAILLCFVFSAVLLLRCRCEKGTKLLLCLFLLLLPLAANAIEVIAPESALCTRMTPGLLSVFYLPLLLAGQAQFTRPRLHRLLPAALAAMLLVTSLNYAWQSNGNDISVSYANQKAENYFATMLTRARSLEGYREDMRIVFVGKTIQDAAFYDNWNGSPFGFSARTSADEQINEYSRSAFIVNYLGIYFRDITPEEETRYAEVIAGMETYPNDGSLCIADDLVLIRLE